MSNLFTKAIKGTATFLLALVSIYLGHTLITINIMPLINASWEKTILGAGILFIYLLILIITPIIPLFEY